MTSAVGASSTGPVFFRAPLTSMIEIVNAADQPAAQEANQQHENHAENQLPGRAEMQLGLQEVAEIKPHRRAHQRPEQRAGTADRRLHHQLPGRIEHEGVRRHEALHDAEKPPGEAGIRRRNDEGRQFVAVDIVTHGRGTQWVVSDGAQHGPDGRTYDTQRDHDADEEPEREERSTGTSRCRT